MYLLKSKETPKPSVFINNNNNEKEDKADAVSSSHDPGKHPLYRYGLKP